MRRRLSLREVSELTGVSYNTLYSWVAPLGEGRSQRRHRPELDGRRDEEGWTIPEDRLPLVQKPSRGRPPRPRCPVCGR